MNGFGSIEYLLTALLSTDTYDKFNLVLESSSHFGSVTDYKQIAHVVGNRDEYLLDGKLNCANQGTHSSD